MRNRRRVRPWIIVQEAPDTTIKEVIEMRRRGGLRPWKYATLMAAAVIGIGLLLVQGVAAVTITATAGANGRISPSGAVTVPTGATKTFTITPNAGYVQGNVLVDGVSVGPVWNYTFTKVPATQPTRTISVTFVPDTDNDGLSDDQELNGITLAGGLTSFPGTNSTNKPSDRSLYLDPNSKDLFVILVKANDPSIPPANRAPNTYLIDGVNWVEYVANPLSAGGLGIAVHVINSTQADANRAVSFNTSNLSIPRSPQKAVRVTESWDTSDPNTLGMSSCGNPNGLDFATVYTQRIVNSIGSVLGTKPLPGDPLLDLYIKHVIAHEIGHMLGPLRKVYDANCGGNHYCTIQPPGTNVIMEQSVYVKGPTFYIGTIYTSTGTDSDQASLKIK